MIKPKYPKRADLSQIARSIVEHATGEPLIPKAEIISQKTKNHHKKHSHATNKTDK